MANIEYVATTTDLNVRTGPDMSHNVIAEVKKGYQVLRIGTCGVSWSKVIYDGCVRYMGTQYLTATTYNSSKDVSGTTVNGVKFTRVNDTVKTTESLNIRTGPSVSYNKVGEFGAGDPVTRIGIGSNGWSQIIYNDKVCYVNSGYLTDIADSSNNKTETSSKQENIYRVTTEDLNVRTGPSVSYKKIGLLQKNETIVSLGVKGEWHQINFEGQVAYVSGTCLAKVTNNTNPNTTPSGEVYYTTDNLNVRTGPSVIYKKIGTLNNNEKVVSLGIKNNWHKINFNGQVGYVNGGYLSKNGAATTNTSSYPMTYKDNTCSITVYKKWWENAYVYAAHVTFTDYDRLWAECAKGKYNSGTETTSVAAKRVKAILAINGDYATPGNGASGYAIARNGVVCNDKKVYSEGVYSSNTGMLLYGQSKGIGGQMLSSLVAEGKVTDTFQFGPAILLDGNNKCNKNATDRAQRTFIGTNGKPGDIWLCVSDGRKNDGKSTGLTAYQCATFLQSEGCTLGVPLDGGGSSTIYFNGKVLNAASNGQRAVADFVMFK